MQLDSQDPLITVRAMKPRGTQESFDPGVPPVGVTIQAGPLLAQFKNNRTVLQDFGDLLAVTGIPIGQPSGAWARAVGLALHQCWREQAARAKYGRAGDGHRTTVKFEPFTRKELLELFTPEPSLQEVLKRNPRRAIAYWDDAIAEHLVERKIIGYYGGYEGVALREWKHDRPRQGWTDEWLAEKLDIRPAQKGVDALAAIADSAARGRKRLAAKKTAKVP